MSIGAAAEQYEFDNLYTFLSYSGHTGNNRGHRSTPSAGEKWSKEFQPILQHAAIAVHNSYVYLNSALYACMHGIAMGRARSIHSALKLLNQMDAT